MSNSEDLVSTVRHVRASADSPLPKRHQLHVAVDEKPMQTDHLGRHFWVSRHTPPDYGVRAGVALPPEMPGIIIFVHGVNTEGEWYAEAEKALCEGLNDRLMRTDLEPNKYSDKDTGRPGPRRLLPKNTGNSPIIRFYWGYRAPDGEERKWRISLRNRSGDVFWTDSADGTSAPPNDKAHGPWYWGGGPFQNGTNSLQALWSPEGFRRRVLGGLVDLQSINTEKNRILNDCPNRYYFAHAVGRLAELIDRIRTEYPHDTISILSHSQGTMVAMAAATACKTRAPDALFVMNSPFALEDKALTDSISYGMARPTTQARVDTFRNVAKRIKEDNDSFKEQRQAHQQQDPLRCGATVDIQSNTLTAWSVDQASAYAQTLGCVPERDNHGRFYVYFSPHDRVMGMSALQSIGWQGVSNALIAELGENVKQRMLARGTPCGAAPQSKTPFGQLPPIGLPMPGVDSHDFWNGNARVLGLLLWTVPPKDQRVNINAEEVPHPLSAEVMSQCAPRDVVRLQAGQRQVLHVGRCFDQAQADQDSVGATDEQGRLLDPDVPYIDPLREPGQVTVDDVYAPGGHRSRQETGAELLKRAYEYQPMPSNHSTLPSHQAFMRQVVAWDLPIGHCDAYLDRDFWNKLMRDADWTQFADEYFRDGHLKVPAVPKEVDPRTVAQEEAKKRDTWEKYGSA